MPPTPAPLAPLPVWCVCGGFLVLCKGSQPALWASALPLASVSLPCPFAIASATELQRDGGCGDPFDGSLDVTRCCLLGLNPRALLAYRPPDRFPPLIISPALTGTRCPRAPPQHWGRPRAARPQRSSHLVAARRRPLLKQTQGASRCSRHPPSTPCYSRLLHLDSERLAAAYRTLATLPLLIHSLHPAVHSCILLFTVSRSFLFTAQRLSATPYALPIVSPATSPVPHSKLHPAVYSCTLLITLFLCCSQCTAAAPNPSSRFRRLRRRRRLLPLAPAPVKRVRAGRSVHRGQYRWGRGNTFGGHSLPHATRWPQYR